MTSADLQSVGGEQHPCPRCGTSQKWEPDGFEADLVKRTELCSYVQLKSKLEPTVREKVFDDCRDRWNAYWAANLATLHDIGAAKYFLDRLHGLAPTLHDTQLLRLYVPAFFTGLTASLDSLAVEIHLLVFFRDPSLNSLRTTEVGFQELESCFKRLGNRSKCAAKCRPQKEAACIERLRNCVLCSEDVKKLKCEVFKWRHAYAHRAVVFSGYFNKCAYLFDPNMKPGDIEKWVPPISPADRALLAKTGKPMLPLLEGYWESARRIIDNSWSIMAKIVDVRLERFEAAEDNGLSGQ